MEEQRRWNISTIKAEKQDKKFQKKYKLGGNYIKSALRKKKWLF